MFACIRIKKFFFITRTFLERAAPFSRATRMIFRISSCMAGPRNWQPRRRIADHKSADSCWEFWCWKIDDEYCWYFVTFLCLLTCSISSSRILSPMDLAVRTTRNLKKIEHFWGKDFLPSSIFLLNILDYQKYHSALSFTLFFALRYFSLFKLKVISNRLPLFSFLFPFQ